MDNLKIGDYMERLSFSPGGGLACITLINRSKSRLHWIGHPDQKLKNPVKEWFGTSLNVFGPGIHTSSYPVSRHARLIVVQPMWFYLVRWQPITLAMQAIRDDGNAKTCLDYLKAARKALKPREDGEMLLIKDLYGLTRGYRLQGSDPIIYFPHLKDKVEEYAEKIKRQKARRPKIRKTRHMTATFQYERSQLLQPLINPRIGG